MNYFSGCLFEWCVDSSLTENAALIICIVHVAKARLMNKIVHVPRRQKSDPPHNFNLLVYSFEAMAERWHRWSRPWSRPMPDPSCCSWKGFRMCNKSLANRCLAGESCTFAHSEEELRLWNQQLEDLKRQQGKYTTKSFSRLGKKAAPVSSNLSPLQ